MALHIQFFGNFAASTFRILPEDFRKLLEVGGKWIKTEISIPSWKDSSSAPSHWHYHCSLCRHSRSPPKKPPASPPPSCKAKGNGTIPTDTIPSDTVSSDTVQTDTTGIFYYIPDNIPIYPNPTPTTSTSIPNPTTSVVTIELNPETCTLNPEIHVFDIYGRRLQIIPVSGRTNQINLSPYPSGIYLIKLTSIHNVITVGRVVKQ